MAERAGVTLAGAAGSRRAGLASCKPPPPQTRPSLRFKAASALSLLEARVLRRNTERSVLEPASRIPSTICNARSDRRGESDRRAVYAKMVVRFHILLFRILLKFRPAVHFGSPGGFELQYSQSAPSATSLSPSPSPSRVPFLTPLQWTIPNPACWIDPPPTMAIVERES